MRRFILLVTLSLVLQHIAAPVYAQKFALWRPFAQRGGAGAAAVKTPRTSHINISRQLDKRVAATYVQAEQAQTQLPDGRRMIMGEPVQKVFKTWELNPQELYPQQTFLRNSEQTGKYLAARNNRLFLQEIRRMEKVWMQIDENLPRLYTEAQALDQPQEPIAWLADVIPPQTTQLFIGEAHGYSEIHQSVANLLREIRSRQTAREIILCTEFLPEELKWTGRRPSIADVPELFHKYFPIWDQALESKIQVIGLELPAAVDGPCEVRYLNARGMLTKTSVWASLEGVRLRNERWVKTLTKYRAQHPDALFIIYTGADHSLYNRPFTLADNNASEKTFVSVLYPNKFKSFASSGRLIATPIAKTMPDPLERLIEDLDFERPVVKWTSPDLPQIAGFDVRIKVPVQLSDIDY